MEAAGWSVYIRENRKWSILDDWDEMNYPLFAPDYDGPTEVDLLDDNNLRTQTVIEPLITPET